jgi:hypothetical protein
MDRFEAVVIAPEEPSVADAGLARPEHPGHPCRRDDRRVSLVRMHGASH